MITSSILLLLLATWSSASFQDEKIIPTERDLRKLLFQDYDKLVRPVKNPHKSIKVSYSMSPIQISAFDEDLQVLVLDSWVMLRWNDEYLKWSSDDWNITVLRIPVSEIWTPDIALYTATPDVELYPKQLTQALIYNNGDVMWVPPYTLMSRCPKPTIKGFTKTFVECQIKFGSWTYSENELDLQLSTKKVDLSNFYDIHPQWKLVHILSERVSKKYPCCVENYPYVGFNVTMKRRVDKDRDNIMGLLSLV